MTFEIIIPHFGCSPDVTRKAIRCLETVAEHSADYRVIFIDNGTDPHMLTIILETLRGMPHLLVRNRLNQGFVKAVNQGLHLSTAPYVVLMNNDTEAVHEWLPKLREPFSDPTVGLVGPRTTTRDSWQGRQPDGQGWRLLEPGRMLAFFCVMMSRKCIETVGYQDEEFVPYGGFGGDDHFCLMAERAGFRLALVQDLIIPHYHRSTFKVLYSDDERAAMQKAALARFHEIKAGT